MQKETAPFVSLACLLACAASLGRPPAHAAQSSANPAAGPTVVYSALVAVPSTPAFSAGLKPGGMAVDPAGDVYLAENVGWSKPFIGGHISGAAGLAMKVNAAGTAIVLANAIGPVYDNSYNGYADQLTGIVADGAGNSYITGQTRVGSSGWFPFVTKIGPDGSTTVYRWVLSGAYNQPNAVAVDAGGNAYVVGNVASSGYSATQVLGSSCGVGGAFVAKVNPQGTGVVYSTCIGPASINLNSVAVDSAGNVYAAGQAGPGFPTTSGAFQPTLLAGNGQGAAIIFKLNPSGSAFVYSTYLGGSVNDVANGIAIDAAGNAYVTGTTQSPDFPVVAAMQGKLKGTSNAFVAKLNTTGSALVYSTYLGGSAVDTGSAIAVDGAGNAYVAGATTSADFPLSNPIQAALGASGAAAFITELNPLGPGLVFSTYLGNSRQGQNREGVALDALGNVYVTAFFSYYSAQLTQLPAPGPIQMTLQIGNLLPSQGTSYEATSIVKLAAAGSALPAFTAAAMTNGASFQPGVAAGGIATVFGQNITNVTGIQVANSMPLPTEIAGTSVIVNNVSVPIFAVANVNGTQQINFQMPANAGNTAWAVVNNNGSYSSPVQVSVTGPPGIFTLDGTRGAVQHGDYSLVTTSKPAAKGEAIIIYATGLGAVQPDPGLGNPASASPLSRTAVTPTVTIGGKSAQVLFSGLAPGFVGLNQVNVVVPTDSPSGDVNVVISIPNVSGAVSKAVKAAVQ